MARHGPTCPCSSCVAKRFIDAGERAAYGQTRDEWRRSQGGAAPSNSSSSSGTCGDCGGTGDCIHCSGGYYPRRDGTQVQCGKCHGRTRRGRYPCHACRGTGYGGRRCSTPTYNETVERLSQTEHRQGKDAYNRGSQSSSYGRSSFGLREGTFDGHPSLSRRRDDGTLDIYYGPNLNLDDPLKGHVVMKNGKIVSHRRPGESR